MSAAALARSVSARQIPSAVRIGLRQQCHPTKSIFSSTSERFFSDKSKNNDSSSSSLSSSSGGMVPSDSNNVPAAQDAIPIDFDAASKIEGEESQICTVTLKPGQVLRAESGAMIYMTHGVNMETTTGSGGVSDGLKRMMTGQNMFISDFKFTPPSGVDEEQQQLQSSSPQQGSVALGTDFPSKIIKLNLNDYHGKLICQRGAYLASNPNVNIEMEFTKKFTTGFFGGEGFILQSLNGQGDVFVKAGGTLVKKELEQGETIRISSGSLVAFSSTVEYDVQQMPGFKNVMFGGEGLFLTTLTGPGTVWLQGLPPDRMISEIARRVPSGGGIGLGIPIGMGGGGGEAGGEAAAGAAAGEAVAGDMDGNGEAATDGGAEDMVASTDAAMEADRQATVASSGMMGDTSSVDSDSPSALFGDAAPEDASSESTTTSTTDSFGNDDMFASSETSFQDDQDAFSSSDLMNDDPSSFSTGDDTDQFQNEFNDETTFSTFDEEGSTDSFDTGGIDADSEGGGVGDVLKSLWDFFTDE